MSVHQISIFLENRAGQLAQVTRVLADHEIDMRAISIAETSDYGVLRLIVDNAEKATSVLLENGFILSMTPVSVVAVPDQAGGLAPVLEALAEGQMDVEYMYSLFTHKEGMAYMVFRIDDEERFAALLSAHGISLADKEELGLK
ncbi:MAG: ACT domain-containing protein [Clostridia bacterium]|nr:ACT domain-containing protein [Clostridia bacterium]